jgi:flagellar motor switch protein FliN/FliY
MTNDGNFLSQDAAAGSDDFNLNSEEIDVIGEVNNIAMGSSATACWLLIPKMLQLLRI